MDERKRVLSELILLYSRICNLYWLLGGSKFASEIKYDESTPIAEIFSKIGKMNIKLDYICNEVEKLK